MLQKVKKYLKTTSTGLWSWVWALGLERHFQPTRYMSYHIYTLHSWFRLAEYWGVALSINIGELRYVRHNLIIYHKEICRWHDICLYLRTDNMLLWYWHSINHPTHTYSILLYSTDFYKETIACWWLRVSKPFSSTVNMGCWNINAKDVKHRMVCRRRKLQ